jgi:hypothetical protein
MSRAESGPALNVTTRKREPSENDAEPRYPASGSRPILDIIVQSCTVELFHSRGVAVAPVSVTRGGTPVSKAYDLVGVMAFSGTAGNGRATLSIETPVYSLFVPPTVGETGVHDLLRELTNQLVGRIKNRLIQFQVTLRIGLPSAMSPDALSRQRPPTSRAIQYAFRTLRGEITVGMDGGVDEEKLSYSSAIQVAKEGEYIAF